MLGNFNEEESDERNSLPYSINPIFRTPTSHSAIIIDENKQDKLFYELGQSNDRDSNDYLLEVS